MPQNHLADTWTDNPGASVSHLEATSRLFVVKVGTLTTSPCNVMAQQ